MVSRFLIGQIPSWNVGLTLNEFYMNTRILSILLLIIILTSCAVTSYGQSGKKIAIKDVVGVTLSSDNYEVVGDIDLKGKTLVIPKGSKVYFKGGKITNGTVVLDGTQLEGDVKIDGEVQGTITNGEIKASWFGLKAGSKADQTKALQSIVNLYESNVSHNSWDINLKNPEPTIVIPAGKYNVGEVKLRSYVTIKGSGRGSTELHGVKFIADRQFNITVEDLSIVGTSGGSKKSNYTLDNNKHLSAFKLKGCARLIFKNVSIKNYDVAFDMYNTYLVDLYSCFVSYCNVCYLNDGDGDGNGGHAVRWFGGELYASKYGFVQKSGNSVLLDGATIENCKCGINFIAPVSFTVDACYFEGNSYDIVGKILHVSVENCYFSESGKGKGDAYIYASSAIGYANFQGNKFGQPISNNPHIMVADNANVYSNIMIGQNFIVNGGRIPVSNRLLPFIKENGINTFQTYLPNGKHMIMGQTVIYKNPRSGKYYIITRDTEGNLLFSPLSQNP